MKRPSARRRTGPGSRHPVFARVYARLSAGMESGGMAEHRARLLAGLRGRVIEVGAGNGLNFGHYPAGVSSVLAVEPEPYLRDLARRRAASASVRVEVVGGIAERLPARGASFDGAVVALVLCSVADQQAALRELYRVLRPHGELRFFEHVAGDSRGLRGVQRLLDATLWPVLAGGCHTSRDTAAAVSDAGFAIERLDRVRFPESRMTLPTSLHVLGMASRPATVTRP